MKKQSLIKALNEVIGQYERDEIATYEMRQRAVTDTEKEKYKAYQEKAHSFYNAFTLLKNAIEEQEEEK